MLIDFSCESTPLCRFIFCELREEYCVVIHWESSIPVFEGSLQGILHGEAVEFKSLEHHA